MNYLAHLVLSGENDALKIGNFIADGLKAKQKKLLPEEIMNGVELHYKIDDFTDAHPIVERSVQRIFNKYGHYSRVIIDLFYDHLLGVNWALYSDQPLQEFCDQSMMILKEYYEILPERSKRFFHYIEKNNTLFEYSKIDGIALVLDHFSHRTKHDSKIEESIEDLKIHFEGLNSDFNEFFPELLSFVKKQEEYN